MIPEGIVPPPAAGTYDGLLSDAVEQSRRARAHGYADQTMTIMRDALNQALRHTGRRFRLVILALAGVLVGVSATAGWRITQLNHEKKAIDQRIQDVETRLQQAQNFGEADRLITQLDSYQDEGEQLQRELLYRFRKQNPDFVTNEIRTLMAEFGAEVYSVPPEFTERAKHYIQEYQGANRPLIERVLGESARQMKLVRGTLEENHLPPDLAYVPLVESALGDDQSEAGAAGIWQFTPATAKAYGLRVDNKVDERLDVPKATRAACLYLRELILDFGSGSSVMLALAAYDLGPTKVKTGDPEERAGSHQAAQLLVSVPHPLASSRDSRVCAESDGGDHYRPEPAALRLLVEAATSHATRAPLEGFGAPKPTARISMLRSRHAGA